MLCAGGSTRMGTPKGLLPVDGRVLLRRHVDAFHAAGLPVVVALGAHEAAHRAVLPPEDWDAAAREHLARTTPLGRLGGPEDVTAAILYLLEGGDYVTGETIVVDGGRLIR